MAIELLKRQFVDHRIKFLHRTRDKLRLSGRANLIALVVIVAYLGAWAFFTVQNEPLISGPDISWEIGLNTALKQGELVGRDLYFSYGPLYQAISYTAAHLNPNVTSIEANLISRIVIVELSIIFLAFCVYLIKPVAWLQIVFIFFGLAVCGMLQPMSIRVIAGLLSILVFYHSLISTGHVRQVILAASAGGLAFITQLLSFDAGIYSISAMMIISVLIISISQIYRFYKKEPLINLGHILVITIASAGVFLIANLAISILFKITSPNYPGLFTYQLRSLEISSMYSLTLGSPWELGVWSTIAFGLMILFTVVLITIDSRKWPIEQTILFGCLLIYSFAILKSATTRADAPHLIYGSTAILFTLLALGSPRLPRIQLLAWAVIVTIFTVSWIGRDLSAPRFAIGLLQGKYSLVERWTTLTGDDRTQLPAPLTELTAQHPDAALLAFPYQNIIPALADRPMVAPILQTYAAGSIPLQEQYIRGLNQSDQPFDVAYSLDQVTALDIDGV